jgi:tetratricopeptide (TPR) repeat protein
MKRLLTVLMVLCCMLSETVWAQTLQIKEFVHDNSDITASTERRLGQDNRPCALVKIQVIDPVDRVEGCHVVGDCLRYGNTTWVYVSDGTGSMVVKTRNHAPVTVDAGRYGLGSLKSLHTYKLVLADMTAAVSDDPDHPSDAKAQYELAKEYTYSGRRPTDGKKYHEWLVASAEQGYVLAQRDYGEDLLKGNYCEKNPALGRQWLRKAADQGNSMAMYILAKELMHPTDSIAPDYPEAIQLLEKAGNRGNGEASLRLAEMYAGGIWNDGKNVKRDKKKARMWYEKAISQGVEAAKTGLRRL